jgi:hypothetical protein
MVKTVRSDVLLRVCAGGSLVAFRHHDYDAWVNQHGAVAAILSGGELGLKPDEFEVIEWHD